MAASQNARLQINYKLMDGTLINVYAENQTELETLLTSVADLSTLIRATQVALSPESATPAGNMAYMKQALGAEEISSDKQCKHGHMALKTGTSAKGPWKAWMCGAPKGATDKCEPIWIR